MVGLLLKIRNDSRWDKYCVHNTAAGYNVWVKWWWETWFLVGFQCTNVLFNYVQHQWTAKSIRKKIKVILNDCLSDQKPATYQTALTSIIEAADYFVHNNKRIATIISDDAKKWNCVVAGFSSQIWKEKPQASIKFHSCFSFLLKCIYRYEWTLPEKWMQFFSSFTFIFKMNISLFNSFVLEIFIWTTSKYYWNEFFTKKQYVCIIGAYVSM